MHRERRCACEARIVLTRCANRASSSVIKANDEDLLAEEALAAIRLREEKRMQ